MNRKQLVVILLIVFTHMSDVELPITNLLSSNNIQVTVTYHSF